MSFDSKFYVVSDTSSIRDALETIQENAHGMVCIASSDERIIAIATDGDIRLDYFQAWSLVIPLLNVATKILYGQIKMIQDLDY